MSNRAKKTPQKRCFFIFSIFSLESGEIIECKNILPRPSPSYQSEVIYADLRRRIAIPANPRPMRETVAGSGTEDEEP